MSFFIVIVHVIVCVALIFIVLLQTGRGADLGAAFGGGASQTLFGSGGASSFLSKLTTAAAVVFMLTSLTLAYVSSRRPVVSIMPSSTPATQEETQLPAPGTDMPAESAPLQSGTPGAAVGESAPAPAAPQATTPAADTALPSHPQYGRPRRRICVCGISHHAFNPTTSYPHGRTA